MERIKGLRAIWLSHRHADHHVGMPLLLATRRQLLPDAPAIPLFGPFPMRKVLSACGKIEDLAFEWHDQYSICPREQGAGRGLDCLASCWLPVHCDQLLPADAVPVSPALVCCAVCIVCRLRLVLLHDFQL